MRTGLPADLDPCGHDVPSSRPLVRDLVMLGPDAVLTLDKRVDEPVDLYVGETLIARGMLEEAEGGEEGQLVVRLTEVLGAGSAV